MMVVQNQKSKKGFTIIEVTLVLAITGLMMIGVISSTYISISRQRYNDSLRSFAEYMRGIYAEALSPESITESATTLVGNSKDKAILGKVVVFSYNPTTKRSEVHSATLTGTAKISHQSDRGFLTELADTDEDKNAISIYCGDASGQNSSVESYTLLWEADLAQANGMPSGSTYDNEFTGTMIIARTPTSATLHTAFAKGRTYDLAGNCTGANSSFVADLKNNATTLYDMNEPTGICVISKNSPVHREVRIAADGRNASAVWLRQDGEDNACCK